MCICRLLWVFFIFLMCGSLWIVVLIRLNVLFVLKGILICWCWWLVSVLELILLVISCIWLRCENVLVIMKVRVMK